MQTFLVNIEPLLDRPYPRICDKGSLDLKADRPCNYSRGVLNCDWQGTRQAEPKDHDISKTSRRNLRASTYDRIGNVTDGSLPNTSYQDFMGHLKLKRYYTEQDWRKLMIRSNTPHKVVLHNIRIATADNEMFIPKYFHPRMKYSLSPPNHLDWLHYNGIEVIPRLDEENPDWSRAVRRTVSQFTDTDNHRRAGCNHFKDESGHYFNTPLKAACPYYSRRPPPFSDRLA